MKIALGDEHAQGLVKPSTTHLDAYQLYLKGRFFWNQRGAGLIKALECFQGALELDPTYAHAHAGLADTLSMMAMYGMGAPNNLLPQGRRAAEEALRLDGTLAEGHNALGFIKFMYGWDFRGAREGCDRALALNPRYVAANYWRGAQGALTDLSTAEEAIADCERALAVDPIAFHPRIVLSWVLIFYRRFAEAVPHLKQVIELQTTFLGQWLLGLAYRELGELHEAVAAGEAAVDVSSRHLWALAELAITYVASGREADALAIDQELKERAETTYVQHSVRAMLAAHLGRTEEAFDLLAIAVGERDGFLPFFKKWPSLDPLRADPRFAEILQRIGFPT
jgi:adenylate cyclase